MSLAIGVAAMAPIMLVMSGCASDPTPPAVAPPTSATPTSATVTSATSMTPGPVIAAPAVPESLKPQTTDAVVLKANAKGVQIYECKAATGGAAALAWTLTGPEAELTDQAGKSLGKHYAGPTWESTDGSKVIGEKVQQADAPQASAVAWLLLRAKSTSGKGALEHVSFVQRVDTTGGKAPPDGCDAAHTGANVRVPYTATYYFYGK